MSLNELHFGVVVMQIPTKKTCHNRNSHDHVPCAHGHPIVPQNNSPFYKIYMSLNELHFGVVVMLIPTKKTGYNWDSHDDVPSVHGPLIVLWNNIHFHKIYISLNEQYFDVVVMLIPTKKTGYNRNSHVYGHHARAVTSPPRRKNYGDNGDTHSVSEYVGSNPPRNNTPHHKYYISQDEPNFDVFLRTISTEIHVYNNHTKTNDYVHVWVGPLQ